MDNSIVTDLYQSKWEKIIHQLDILYNEGRIDEEYNKKHPKKFNITQPGESPQVVVLTMDGKEHTESFSAPLYTPFLVVLKGNNPKHLVPNTEGGILANDIDIMAVTPDAIANLCAVILLQDSDKQVIWANHNDAGYNNKESFFVKRGDNCTFMVIANNPQIYEPGRLNVTELNNIEKNINYVYATAVIPKSSEQQNKIFINIIQSIHQTITVTTEDGVAHTEAFLCDIGTKYTAKIEVESDWYVAGQLNIPLTGEFKTNTIVRATPFVWNKFNVHIIQKPNQVLTVNIDNQTITNTRDIVVLVNTSWNASVKANEGYIAGSIIPGNSGVIVKETTITVSSAQLGTFKNGKQYFKLYSQDGTYHWNRAVWVVVNIEKEGDYKIRFRIHCGLGYNPSSSGPWNSAYQFTIRVDQDTNKTIYDTGDKWGDNYPFTKFLWVSPSASRSSWGDLTTTTVHLTAGQHTLDLFVGQHDKNNKNCDTYIDAFYAIFGG